MKAASKHVQLRKLKFPAAQLISFCNYAAAFASVYPAVKIDGGWGALRGHSPAEGGAEDRTQGQRPEVRAVARGRPPPPE
jgi:hypothetical protein